MMVLENHSIMVAVMSMQQLFSDLIYGQTQRVVGPFTYAGSQSVIMSFWSVPDYSTSKIAQQFYAYYHQGLPKDIAQQRAELYFLDHEAKSTIQLNPHHWAAFTVNGDMSPLETTEKAFNGGFGDF